MARGRFLDSDGATYINGLSLGTLTTNSVTDKKLFIQNDKSRVLGQITLSIETLFGSDLASMMTWSQCPKTLSCPYDITAALQSGGTLLPNTVYYYRITAYNDHGETVGSFETYVQTDTSNKSIQLSWHKVYGASGYRVYRSTTSESYVDARVQAITDPNTLTWTDTGASTTAYSLPSANTTGGAATAYGAAPAVLSASDIIIPPLGVGEQFCFWLRVTVGEGVSEAGNTRYASLYPTEASTYVDGEEEYLWEVLTLADDITVQRA